MDQQKLYELETTVWQQIHLLKEKRDLETKCFVEGMEKGLEMMMKAVRDCLTQEDAEKAQEQKG